MREQFKKMLKMTINKQTHLKDFKRTTKGIH